MMLKIKALLFALCIYTCSFGQKLDTYQYKRELKGIKDQWHKIIVPDDVLGKTHSDLSDVRIFGITTTNDTIEAPFLLRLSEEKTSNKEAIFKLLNSSHNASGFYYTFEIQSAQTVNQIKLNFEVENFDWQTKLEGSQNQQEWFTISDNYRILSIKNEITDFKFTDLVFPNSKYKYYRLRINSKEEPSLTVASISQCEIESGTYRNYPIKTFNTKENKETKQTEILLELNHNLPVSLLKIESNSAFDYYRAVTIKSLTDSIQTEQGLTYVYSTIASGILNSTEKSEFKFPSTSAKYLKIFIDNQDNQPLSINQIKVKGFEHEMITRFTEPATYFLVYGNELASMPNYDIAHFTEKVPKNLKALQLDIEYEVIKKEAVPVTEPLFKNTFWLWTITALIILILGWFSVKMIRK